ncbi:MAG: prolyl oligopeptidase family serine peptidase [Burkholderiaceae bacterium]|nr:prolyl oligopeptidase family serine peptidase [Burkholderiaceae bacterium]
MLRTLAGIALLSLSLTAHAAASTTQAASPASIPVEQFFQRPEISGAAISPNGRFIALRRLSPQGRYMLAILDVDSKKIRAVANFKNGDVALFKWLSDQRLSFTTINVDHDGDTGQSGIFAIDRDGSGRNFLSPTSEFARSFADSDPVNHNYLSAISMSGFPYARDEDMFVIARYVDAEDLVRMSTRTGRIYPTNAPRDTFHWLIDADGEPRITMARRGDDIRSYFRDDKSWQEFERHPASADDGFRPLLYAEDKLYVRARNGHDEAAIYRYDIASKTLLQPALIVAPEFDTDGYFVVGARKPLGFRFNTDAENTVWFDPAMKAIQQQVDEQFPGLVNIVSRGTRSETPYVLVDTHSDVQSHAYLLYNTETRAVELLGSAMPDIDTQQMASMTMERFAARDGRKIPVYLSVPRGERKQPYPTVVLNGSNRLARNGLWEWNAEVQFLASRGYAVLQVNPRGSMGFGMQHLQGNKADAVANAQTDLADAVQWAAAQGYTDPARVCVAGGGDGGYAAMKALLKQPQAFKCGISWSTVTHSKDDPDSARFAEIRQPLLLGYDHDSQRLDYQQGRALYEALKANQAPVTWLEYRPGVQDWKTQQPRIDFWRQIERFLASQIGSLKP